MSDTDGCENRCVMTEMSPETRCDNRDNDCDGLVDEDFDLQNDPVNCGICGRTCRFAHAMASCAMGACTISGCDMGYSDADGLITTGC